MIDTTKRKGLYEAIAELECQMISEALEICHGVRTTAARLLGVKRTTLSMKIKKLGLNETTVYGASNKERDKH